MEYLTNDLSFQVTSDELIFTEYLASKLHCSFSDIENFAMVP